MLEFGTPVFWVALLQIIGVNIVLSGDNAVVIALAARSLPPKQQKQAVMIGSAAAVAMRIILTIVAVELLRLPYLKIVGALLLLWIGIQLLVPEEAAAGEGKTTGVSMLAAVRTILLADLVMSVDNVIAVAAAAKGSLVLLIVGLAISIPLVIFGSTMLMKYMERWPIIVTLGAALLGWVAGDMAVSDPLVMDWVDANAKWLHYAGPAVGAVFVVAIGKWLAARAETREDTGPIVDLAVSADQSPIAAVPSAAAAQAKLILLVIVDEPVPQPALEHLRRQLAWYRHPPEVHLLNVQHPAHGDVTAFVDKEELKDFHHDQGSMALQPVRQMLERAGMPYVVHIGVGSPAHVGAHYAKEIGCQQIFLIGGEPPPLGAWVVSTATDLIQLANVPITLLS